MITRPTFEIAEGGEVLIVTHLLELPHDLGLPEGVSYALFEPRDDVFIGWSDENKARLLQLPRVMQPGMSPRARLVFRRLYVPERAESVAAFAAFLDWTSPIAPPGMIETLEAQRAHYMEHGSFGWVTVVAVSTFVAASEWPADEVDRAALQGRQLDDSLTVLNDFFSALSLTRNDPSIRPIARGDLPRMCPVILETTPSPSGVRNATSYPYQIHHLDRHAYGESRQPSQLDHRETRAFEIAKGARYGGEPFFPFYELMQDAIGAFNEGRYRVVALSVGTAIEVLLSTIIRTVGYVSGHAPEEIERVLGFPHRNFVEDHLPRYANCEVDLNSTANPFGRWWQGGYALRNRVVHQGYAPSRDEARSALDNGTELIATLRQGLLGQPETSAVGDALQWGAIDDSSAL